MKFVIFAVLCMCVIAHGDEICPTFTCDSKYLFNVTILDKSDKILLECPRGLICNINYNPLCSPCVADNYSGTGLKDMCEGCTVKKCSVQDFKCLNDVMYTMLKDNSMKNCPIGSICNWKFVEPCTPCIESSETTTESTSESTDESTTENTGETTTENTSESTTEITSTTTTTTTTPKPFETPNCNDGSGWSKPCREGPVGYYFKCIRNGIGFSFNTVKLSCDNIYNDSTCRNAWVCMY